MNRLRPRHALAIVALAGSFSPVGFASLQIDAQLGFDRQVPVARANEWTPITVIIQNNGPDTEGVVRFRALGDKATAVSFWNSVTLPGPLRKTKRNSAPPPNPGASADPGAESLVQEFPLTLPKNSTKQVRDVVFLRDTDKRVQVEVLSGRTVVTNLSLTIRFVADANPTALVVGDEDWTRAAQSSMREVPPTHRPVLFAGKLESMADNAFAYSAMDTVVLDRGEWNRLLAPQAKALRGYVERGGHLVVSTGRATSLVRNSPMAEWLPVDLGETVELQHSHDPGVSIVPTSVEKGLAIAEARLRRDAAGVILRGEATGKRPMIVEGRLGNGTVTFLAFQLSDPVLRNWPGRLYLWHFLFGVSRAPVMDSRSAAAHQDVQGTLQNLTLLAIPTANQVGLLLLVFVGAIIPLNHLVWRFLKRPIGAWTTLPLLSLGLGGAVVVNERIVTGSNLSLAEFTVAHVEQRHTVAAADTFLSLQSPFAERYVVRAAWTNLGPLEWYPQYAKGLDRRFARLPTLSPAAFEFDSFRNDLVAFRASHTMALGGGIELRTELKDTTLRGVVENRSVLRFEECGVLTPRGAVWFGPLTAGEQRALDLKLLPLGSIAGKTTLTSAEGEQILSLVEKQVLPKVEARQRIVFWGLARGAPLDVKLADEDDRLAGITREIRWTLVVCEAPFELGHGPFEIAPPQWRARVVAVNKDYEPRSYEFGHLPATFAYQLVLGEARPDFAPTVDASRVLDQLNVEVRCPEGQLRVELFDYSLNRWELVGSPTRLIGRNAVKCVHPRTGVVLVQLTGWGNKSDCSVHLSLTGKRDSPPTS